MNRQQRRRAQKAEQKTALRSAGRSEVRAPVSSRGLSTAPVPDGTGVTVAQALALAVQHHQAGQLQHAEALYRQILELDPDQPDALNLLGVLASQVGRHDVAVELIGRAVAVGPRIADFHSNLGNALKALNRLDEAVASYRQAIALKPNHAKAHNNLAAALEGLGALAEAAASCRRALALEPDYAEAHNNLAAVLNGFGRFAEAAASSRRALALQPAIPEAHNNLGNALKDLGELDAALASYGQALALRPDYAEAHSNLGAVLSELGRHAEAEAAYRRALELRPVYPEALCNLGNTLRDQGRLTEAIGCFEQALIQRPAFAEAHNGVANALRDTGRLAEAVEHFRRAVALRPDHAGASSNLLLTLQYDPAATREELLTEARAWSSRHSAPLAREVKPHTNDRDPARRLRIGYLSADFRRHPVGYFLDLVLRHHDRSHVESHCYSNHWRADDLTTSLRSSADHWRSVVGLADADLADQIRADGIDILVDLSGHTAGNRLLVFARKPAPVQATWLGYFDTTGLETIDYLISDERELPAGSERWLSERPVRLPIGNVCYAPPEYAPAVAPLPALSHGHVTFGCFTNLSKVSRSVVALWSSVLRAAPSARFVLKAMPLDDAAVRERYRALFAAEGITSERVDLVGWSPHPAMLAEYGGIDVVLDPSPFTGGLSTCEALWMGVPVVTLAGDRIVSRQTLNHLTSVGLPDLAATSLDQYAAIAADLGANLDRLRSIRATLRERMAASSLCDGPGFTHHLESAYRQMWRRWCATPS